ncbi:hypothetical protein NLI96_g11873 [Meripilus lineatus]|uniref:Uncharacterized protein n=1 Tax=Meripilus lineatus TaxID=2056292 RepID=A0AAD5UTG8_9APHY|nr:hypothetical protein NLI96_g11873 [Physisporinus lineatus]
MGVGIIGLVGKLHKWDDSAMFFDGSSLAVYLSVGVPASRTIATPVQGVDTREDQIEALRILSAGNVIMIVLLGAILTLQGGEEYVRRIEEQEQAKAVSEEKVKAKTKPVEDGGENKKDK